jgi:hypothetical protein
MPVGGEPYYYKIQVSGLQYCETVATWKKNRTFYFATKLYKE